MCERLRRLIHRNYKETDLEKGLIQPANLLNYDSAKVNLLDAVRDNEEENVNKILEEYPTLIEDIYEDYKLPILYIACKSRSIFIKGSVVQLLINKGADPFRSCSKWIGMEMEAIHFASIGQNPEILEVIIKIFQHNPRDINALTAKGETALHILLHYDNINLENKIKCTELLLMHNLDPNLTNDSNVPPIYYSSKNKFYEITKLLLDFGADINYEDDTKKCVAEYISELNLKIAEEKIKPIKNLQGRLYELLKSGKYEEFIEVASNIDLTKIKAHKTLLQLAVEKNLLNFAQYLIESRCDPNETTEKNKNTPVLIAAMKGHFEIFKILLKHPKIVVEEIILRVLIKHIDSDSKNYLSCYNLLKSSDFIRSMQVNSVHNFIFDDCNKLSFEEGEFYNKKDLTTYNYKTLKSHFDQCIEAESNIFEKNQRIEINYTSLLPAGSNLKYFDLKSVQFVLSLSESKQLKNLLAHPVISSFIFINWLFCKKCLHYEIAFFGTNFLQLLLLQIAEVNGWNLFNVIIPTLVSFIILLKSWFIFTPMPWKVKKLRITFRNLQYILVVVCMLSLHTNLFNKNRNQLKALLLLYIAMNILILMGYFSNSFINIIIFKTVALNYLKFLMMFLILLLAISGSFHMLQYYDNKPIYISFFKVIMMLGGEFDFESIEFDLYPVFSRIFLSGFIVIISLALLNLLNALAVRDTEEIKNKAELNQLIFRANYITAIAPFGEHLRYFYSFYIKKSKRLLVNRKGKILAKRKKFYINQHGIKEIFSAPEDEVHLDDGIMEDIKVILESRHDNNKKLETKLRQMENHEIINSKLNYLASKHNYYSCC